MRATLWFGGAISKRITEINMDNVTSNLTQFSFRNIDEFNNFVILPRYLAAKPKHCSHLLWSSLILVFRDRNLRIIGWGNFVIIFTFWEPYVRTQLIPRYELDRPFLWLVFLHQRLIHPEHFWNFVPKMNPLEWVPSVSSLSCVSSLKKLNQQGFRFIQQTRQHSPRKIQRLLELKCY